MEYRIEIVGKETQKLYRQLYYKVFSFSVALGAVLLLLAAILSTVDAAEGKPFFSGSFLFCALYSVLLFLLPELIARMAYRNKMKYYDNTMPESIVRFGEQIRIEDVDSSHMIPYEKLTKIYFLKDGIAFKLGKQKIIGIPNETFTTGSLLELKQLLCEKRPDLKIPE